MKSQTDLKKLLLVAGFWLQVAFAVSGQATTTTLASSNNPRCEGFDITFTATIDQAGATGTVEFLDGATVIGSSTVSGGNATYLISTLSAGTHSITAHYLGDGTFLESTSAPLSQLINGKPTVNATPASQPAVCSGELFTTINFTGTAISYNWTRDNTTFLVGLEGAGVGGTTSIDGALTNLTTIQQTSNFVIVGVDANGCVNTANASVIVNPAPQIAAIAGPSSVCTGPGNAITLTDATASGTWASSNPAVATINSSGLVTGIANGSVIITYNVTSGLGCAGSVIKSINVNDSPAASVSSGAATICSGQSTTITGTASIAPSQIVSFSNTDAVSWDFRQGVPLTPLDKTMIINLSSYGITSLSQISNISVTVNVDHPRDQEVEMYLVAPGGVILNDKPTLPYNTPYTQNYATVPNHVIPLVNNRGGSGSNFINTVFVDGGASLATGTAPFSGSYQPEFNLSSLDQTIDPTGVWTLRMVDEKSTGYTGRYRSFTISFTIPGIGSGSLLWSSAPNDPSFTGTTSPGTYPVSPTQTTTYTLTATGSNGCITVSSTTLTVLPPVVVNAGPDQSKCNIGNFTLAGNTPASGTGLWTVAGGTATITNASSPNATVSGVPPGTSATLRWSIMSAPCAPVFDDVILTNGAPPTVSGITICQGGSGSVTALGCPPGGTSSTGATNGSTGANVTGVGTQAWVTPGNALTNNNSYATVTVNNATSNYLQTTNYGFSIPSSATINGIQVTIGRFGTQGSGNDVRDNVVSLIKNGIVTVTNNAITGTDWPTSEAAQSYGGAANLWGSTWTPADINATNFGVALAVNSSNNRTASVDYIQINVTYTLPVSTVNWYTGPSGGSVVGTGSPFNPVPSVIANTNTPGTYTFYAECSTIAGCRSTVANFVIDPVPTAFSVTGGGSYCSTGSGVVVGLSGSQTGVNYQLQVGAVNTGAPVGGTGSAISFGLQTAAGSYTVVATSTLPSACQNNMNGSVPVSINPGAAQPGAFTVSTNPVCQGNSNVAYTVPNDATVTYTWSYSGTGATIIGTGNSVLVSFSASATSGNLSVIATNSCGPSPARTLAITVNSLPATPGTITGNANVCRGQIGVVYTVPVIAGAVNYAWSPPVGATITAGAGTNSITVSFSAVAVSGNFTVRGQNACGVGPVSAAFPVIVSIPASQPGAFTASTATVCQGQSGVTYTVPNDLTVTYAWTYSGTGATINGTTNSVTVDFSATATSGTLSVSAVNGCGTSTPRTIAITVNSLPAQPGAFTASTATVCQGQNNVTYTVPNDPAVTYTWSYSGTGATISGTTNSVTVSYSATATSGTLSVTANNTCGASTARTLAITVNSLPAQPGAFTASTATVCQGQNNVTYTVPNDPTVTYTWSYSGTGATITGTTNSVTVSYSATATSGTLSVTATNSCGTSAARTLAITVNPLPAQPGAFTASTATVCQGQSNVTYTVPNVPTVTYTWSYSGTGATITGTTNSVTVSYSATATSGTLSVTATNSCGTSTARTLDITVNPLPAQPGAFTASTATVCQGQNNVTYTVPNDPTVTYTWSYSGTGATITGTTNSVTISYSATATSGTLSVTATNSCGTSAARTLAITVNPIPAQPGAFTASTATVCQGQSNVTYTVPNVPTVTYNWSYSGTGATITGTTNSVTISYSATATSGTLSVTATNSCGTSTARTLAITVNPLPAQPGAFTASTATVCQGQNNVTYTVPIDPTVTYNWSYSGTGATITGTTNSVTVSYSATATSGTLSVTATNSCGTSTARTLDITVNPLPAQPGAFTASTATVCQGQNNVTYTVPNDPTVTYTWSYSGTGATITGTTNSVTISYSATATSGTLSVTATNSCGTSAARTLAITVNPIPAQPGAFTASTATVCQGQSNVTYTVPNVPTVTYNWSYSGTGATITGTTNSVTISYSATATSGTLSVTATNSCGTSTARTLAITVNPLPAQPGAFTASTATVCQGQNNVTYTVPIDPTVTYNWSYSGTGATITGTTNSVTVSYSATATSGTLSVTATNSCGTSTARTLAITVNSLPAQPGAFTASTATVCQGQNNVTYTVPNDPTVTYTWSYSGTGATITGTTNSVTVSYSATATSGTLSVTATNSCGTSAARTLAITVNPIPAQPGAFTASTATVCQGQSNVTYTVPNVPTVTYNWSYSGTGATITGTTNSVTVSYSATATSGTLSVTATNSCGTSTARTLSITVNPLPSQPGAFTASTATVCQGQNNVTYTVPNDPTVTYTWSYSGTGATITGTTNSVTVSYSATATSGTLSVTATNSCGTSIARTLSITVNILPAQPGAFTASTATVCQGQNNVTYTVPNDPTVTYTWSYSGTGATITGTTNSVTISYSATATSGTLSVTATNSCGTSAARTLAITVNPIPAQPGAFTASTATVCQGQSNITYTVPNVPTVTYNWSYSGTGATITGTTNSVTISYSATATSGTLSVTATNSCGTSTARTLSITVNPLPAQPGAFTASTATVCQGQSGVTYTVPNDPAVTYNWSYSGTGATITGTTNSVTVSYSATATSGTLSVTATNSCGTSIARTLSITVNILPAQPGAFTASTSTVCQGQNNVTYTVPNDPAVTYTWSYSGTGATITGTTNSVTVSYSATATSGTLSVTATNSCGTSTARTLSITVNPLPAQPGAFTAFTATVCQGQSNVTYTVPNVPTVTYTWSYSGTGATITGTTNSVTVSYSATATAGTLSVTATNSCGTSIARTLSITVNPLPAQPGAFTASTATVCQGQNNVTYTVPNDPTVTYNWSYSGTGATITGTTNSVTVSYSATATAGTLSVTATNSCGTSVARTLAITVNPLPAQPGAFTASTAAVCQGQSGVTYTVPNVPAVTYTWSYSGTGATITGTTNSVTVSYSATATSGTLSVTATNSCGTSTARTLSVTVNPVPTVIITNPAAVCAPATANLTLPAVTAGSTAGLTFTYWTDAAGTIAYTTPTTAPAGTYYIKGTTAAGCFDITPVTVTVSPAPTVVITNPATVCAPATVNLTLPAVTAGSTAGLTYTYWTDAAGTLSYATPTTATAGIYYIKGTAVSGCFDIKPVTVTVSPAPTVVITNPPAVCAPATANLTLAAVTAGSTAGLTYTYWTDAAGTIAYTTPTTASAGTYYIKGTTAAGCFDIKPVTVTVNPAPTVVITNPAAVCAPATVNLTLPAVTAGSTAGLTYTYWTDAAGTISYSTPTTAAAGTYYIKGTAASGCFDIKPVTVTVNPAPTVVITNPAAVCAPATVNLTLPAVTAGSTAGLTFTYWTDAAGTVSYATPTTAVAGTYYIKGTAASGCFDIKPVTVTVSPVPTVVITNPAAVCAPATVNLTLPAVTAGSTPGLTYTYWTNAAGTISYATPATATTGTYYIKGTTAGGCFDIKPVTVTINPAPTVVITNPAAVCAPATVNITLPAVTAGSTAGLTFTYWTDAAGTISYATPATASAGTYYIKGTAASGCFDIKPVTVTVSPAPTVVITNPAAACAPATVNLTLSAVTAGSTAGLTFTYWTDAAGTISYATPTTAAAGIYYIKGTAASGCFDIKPVTVTVNAAPTVVITNPAAICAPGTANLTLAAVTAGSTAGLTYTYWTDAAGTVSYPTPTTAAAGTYYIKGTAASGCYDIKPVTVTVNPAPVVTNQTTSILSGDTFTVTPAGVPVGTTYTWTAPVYTGTVSGGSAQASPQANISGTLTGTGTATYTVTPTSGSCIGATFTVTVTVTTGCTPVTIGTQPANISMCSISGNVSFTVVTNGTAPFTYQWQYNNSGTWASVVNGTPAGAVYTNGNTATLNVTGITSGGTYQYRVNITNCSGANNATSNAATLTVNPTPAVVITNPAVVCAPGTVNLTLAAVTAGSTAGLTYTYWTDAAGTISYATPANAAAGTYYIKGTTAAGCFDIKPVTVTVNPVPSVVITNPAAVCAPATVNLTLAAVTAGSTAGLTYTYWTDAAGTIAYTTPTTAAAGTYYIKGTTAAGCFDIKPVTVTVNPAPTVVITNPAAVCAPATVNLTLAAVTAGSTAGLTYTYWTNAAGTIAYTTPATAAAGTYYIRGTAASGCSDIKPVTVTVNPTPTVVITNPAAVCAPGTANLTLAAVTAGSTAGLTYTYWTDAAGTVSYATPTTAAAGTYYIKGTTAGGCFDIKPVTVTVNPLPNVTNQTTSILSGDIFTVTPAGVPLGTTYTWTAPVYTGSVAGGSAQASPQANISGTLTGTGSATYTVTPASGSCIGATFTVIVTVTTGCTPVTIGTQPANTSLCATSGNASFTVVPNGTAPFTYQWQYNNSGTWGSVVNGTPAGAVYTNAISATMSVTGIISSGSYQYRVFITNCSASNATSNQATLTVNPAPTVVITNPAAVCAPATVNLTLAAVTAGSTAGLTYTYWTDAAGTIAYATPATAAAGIYYIKGTTAASCFDIKPVTVTVNPAPTVVITNPAAVCPPATVNLTLAAVTAGSTAGLTYSYWTNAAGTIAYATPATATAGTYYIKGTAGSGCFDIKPVTVTVNPAPTVVITNPAAICAPGTANLTSAAVTAGSTAGLTYTYWTDAAGTVSYATPTTAAAGTYYIKGTTAAGCFDIKPVAVTVNPLPNVTNQTTSILSGDIFTVTPAGVPVGTTYTWTAPVYTGSVAGGSAQASPQANISGTLTGTGTATYTVTPASGSCIGATFTVTVTVTTGCTPVTIGTQPANTSLCSTSGNASFTVVANGTAPFTYQWQYNNSGTWAAVVNGTPAGAVYTNANTSTLGVAGITAAGSYQYRTTIANCSGANNTTSNPATLTVNPSPTVVITNPAAVCAPATANLTLAAVTAGSTAGLTYTYWTDAAGTIAYATPANAVAGTYYIKGTTGAGCFDIKPVTVTSNPAPTVVITNPAAVCAPATVNLTLAAVTAGSTAGLTYTYWTDAAGTVSYATPTTAAAGIYYIKGTTAAGCSDIKPVTGTVNPVPNVTNQTTSILSGNIFTVTPAGVPVGTTYTWTAPVYTGSVTGGSAQAAPQANISGTLTGTGTATYTVTPASGSCIGATFTVTVTVTTGCTPVTIGTQPADISMCATSGIASFTVVPNGTAPFTYQWEYNNSGTWAAVVNGTPAGAAYTNTTTASLGVAGITAAASYQYRVYITNCTGANNSTSNAGTLTVNPAPTVVITNPAAVCAPGTANLTLAAVTAGSTAGLTFSYWTDAAGTIPYATSTTAAAGTYYIKGTTAGGCFDIKPVTVTVNPLPNVTNQTTSILSGDIFAVTPAGVPVGTTYTWTAPVYTGSVTGGSAQAAPQANISGTLTGTGTAIYTVTPASGSCVGATFTVTVTVTTGCAPVTIGTQPADNSMCATSGNTSFTVVTNGTAPFTYQWEYNNGGTWAAVVNGTPAGAAYTNANTATMGVAGITADGSYQYRAYITNCTGANNATSNAVTLTVNPLPAVANQATSILSGDIFTVTPAGVPVGTTYTWTAPVYTGSVTGGSAQAAPQANISGTLTGTGTAIYTVTPASGSCVGATFTVTVTVTTGCAPVTIGTQPADNSMCATSGNTSFTVVTNGTAPFTYQWEYNNGGTWAAVVNGTPAGATYTNANTATMGVAGITADGSYQYRVYITNCTGANNSTSNAVTLTVNPLPAVANQTTSILSGDTFTVTPAGVPVGTTYTWTAPVYTGSVTGGSAQAAPQANISGTLTGTGTATHTVTPASGSCIGSTFTVTVTVTAGCAPVTIGTQPADNSMCATSGNTSFTVVTNGTAPFTWQWEYNNGGTWAAVVNGTPAGATYTNANTATMGVAGITADGSYQYRAYITNCSGANNATSNAVTLAVNPLPAVANQTTSILSGDTFTVTPAGVPVGTTYTWTAPVYTGSVSGGSAQAAPQSAISGTLSGTGTATYTVTPASGTCVGATFTVTVTVTIGCIPVTIGTQPADISTCTTSGNASFTIVANGTAPFTYQWEYNNGGTWTSVVNDIPAGASYTNANTAILSVTGLTSIGNYQYRAYITNCSGANNATSNVVTLSVNPVPSAPTVGTITQPSCAEPTGSVVLDGLPATGTWTINPGAITNSGVSTTIPGLAPGTYNFTVTNSGACTSPASAAVELAEPQTFSFTVATSTSTDGHYNIDCAGAESGYITVETINATGAVDYLWSDGETGNTRANLVAGTYRVIMTDANQCHADSSITLTEPELIKLVFDVTEPTCPETPDGAIDLTVSGGVAGGDYAYLWSDNSTGSDLTDIPAGSYQVMVTDANLCSETGSVDLVSKQEMCLKLYDVFSPNGDLMNDVWNIGNTNLYPSMEITIYNRWGQSVWKSGVGYPVPWDGKSNGVDLPVDSYHYVIELHNGTKPYLGTVTIVR